MGEATQGVDFDRYPTGAIQVFDETVKNTDGSPYLTEDYQEVKIITTYNDTIVFNESRYNTFSNNLEFKDKNVVKYLPSDYIKKLLFYGPITDCLCDEFIIINKSKTEEANKLIGVVSKSKDFIVGNQFYYKIIKSNYNPTFDHGNKNDEIKVKSELVLIAGTKVVPLEVNKRKFSKYFNQPKKVLKEIKQNDYSYDKPDDLLKILNKFELRSI